MMIIGLRIVNRFSQTATCHAVIHLGGECRTIEQMRELRNRRKSQN